MDANIGIPNPETKPRSIETVKTEILAHCHRLFAAAGIGPTHSEKETTVFVKALATLRRQPRWYQSLAPLYAVFEDYAALTDPVLCEAVLCDPAFKRMLPELYALRACYEADLEWDKAERAIAAPDPPAVIRGQVDHKIRSLPGAFYEVLQSSERILMAGSGPLPTTAMALVGMLKRPVHCLDHDARANSLGAHYVRAGGYGDRIDFVVADLRTFDWLEPFDAIVGAFLIGVGTAPESNSAKTNVVRSLLRRVNTMTTVVLRTPQALGALIYPSLTLNAEDPADIRFYPATLSTRQPYDSTFAVLHCRSQ